MKPLDLRLLRNVRSARRYVALTVGLGITSAALMVAQAWMIAKVLAPVVLGEDISTSTILWALIGLALVISGLSIVAWARERYALRAAAQTIAELRRTVVESWALRSPRSGQGTSGRDSDTSVRQSNNEVSPEADIATLATRGLNALEPYLVRYVPQLVLTALVTPALVCVVLGLDWISAVIVLVTLPLVPLFMVLVGRLTAGTSERRLATVERLGAQVLDLVAGLPTLRAFGRTFGPGERVRALGDASSAATMRTLRVAFLSSMVLELLTTLSVAIVAVGVGLRLVEGAMDLQPAIAVLVLAPEVYVPLRRVGAEFHASVDGIAAIERVFSLMGHTPSSSQNKYASVNPPRDITGNEFAGATLVLDRVSVKAPGRGVIAPANLSASIPLGTGKAGGGRIVALRGVSGSGKSTALLTILGLLTPDTGRVGLLLPNGATSDLDSPETGGLKTWWSAVTWVPQRPSLPPGRLRDVVLGSEQTRPHLDTTLAEVTRLTGLDTVIRSLPYGWDTPLGLGGVGLSVGQRQRVALTSALLNAASLPPLVILDEPTAHLDADGEQAVLNAVRMWRNAGRTVLVVAHRASLLAIADHIIEVRSARDPASIPDGESAIDRASR